MGFPMLGDFAESAQQPTVHFKIQPATQPTQCSDIQLNEAISSNQSTVAPDCPTVFPNEPTPYTAATPTASAGRIVKASSLSPLPSVSKQGTSDARSYMPGSAPNWSRHRGWRCRLQTHATNSTVVSPFARNSRTVKPCEDRRRDVKPPIVPSSELGVSSGPEEEDGWRKESEAGADVECL